MARFEDVPEESLEDEEEGEEEDQFADIDLFGEKKAPEAEPEDKFTYIRDKLRALAADFRGTMNAKNDAFTKSFIELFGKRDKETEYGLEGKIDDEFEDPALVDLMAAKYWRAFKERLKVVMLQNKDIKNKMMEYLAESNKLVKELLKLYLELEEKYDKVKGGEMDEREVQRKYFGAITKVKEDQLKQIYEDCGDIAAYRALLHPQNTKLSLNEKMFIKAVNSVVGKFREGEDTRS